MSASSIAAAERLVGALSSEMTTATSAWSTEDRPVRSTRASDTAIRVAYAGKVVGPGLRDGRRRRHSNPAAETDPGSPIYGMPILKVNHSRSVIVLKRSMSFGFAGIDNDLYYDPKTTMLLGDAKSSVGEIVEELMAL